MNRIHQLLAALDERRIAQQVGIPHDEARMSFRLERNTVRDWDEFEAIIGAYYTHHSSRCVAVGSRMAPQDARTEAKELLEREYRRQTGGMGRQDGLIVAAFNAAHDGTDGGLRKILDIIADALRQKAVANYIRDAFDRFVRPTAWSEKVEIIDQLLQLNVVPPDPSIDREAPERYAHDYTELVNACARGQQNMGRQIRRL